MQSEQIDEPNINKWLSQQNYYHGFLPREDLPFILKKKGDFILRCSERPTPKGRRREIVLSVAWPPETVAIITNKEIKNVVIDRSQAGFTLDANRWFSTIEELIHYYRNCPLLISKISSPVLLNKPVGLASWEYKHSQILLVKKVGAGAYGEVFKGKIKRGKKAFEAAIKSMRTELSSDGTEKTKEVMAEARLMRMLNHPNIVRIRGIAVLEQPIYIIIDFINGGGLDSYLKKHAKTLTIEEKNKMSISAAWGIEFMHSQDIIHRDIAARNCLYDTKNYVKLSDFGLSRKGNMYKMKEARKMPTKWMAPESLQSFIFYKSSDVYTYGVLLYEIYTCQEPFKSVSSGEARKRVMCGEFLSLEKDAPEEINTMVVSKVFHTDHKKRSTMSAIVKYLEEWMQVELVIEAEEKEVEQEAGDSCRKNNAKDSKRGSKRNKKKNRTEVTEATKDETKIIEETPQKQSPAISDTPIQTPKKKKNRETEEVKPDMEAKTLIEKEGQEKQQYFELKPVSIQDDDVKDTKDVTSEKKEAPEKSG